MWHFASYSEIMGYLEEELECQTSRTSRTRDLILLRDVLVPTAQQWGVSLDLLNMAALAKLRLILPRTRREIEKGDKQAFSRLLELAAGMSWRRLRRELGTLHRHRVTVQIQELSAEQVEVSFAVCQPVWATVQRVTRDHIQWIEEVS